MSRWPSSEVELGRAVAPALRRDGWTLYPEVPLPSAVDDEGETMIPDLIGVNHRRQTVALIELKTHVGVDLLADCARWVGNANVVLGIAPALSRDRRRSAAFAHSCLAFERVGAGLILVDEDGQVERVVTPRFVPTGRVRDIGIGLALQNAREGYAEAGSPGSANRCRPSTAKHEALRAMLLELLERRPKISVARALAEIEASLSFKAAVRQGRVSGIAVQRGRFVVLAERTAA